MRSEFFLTLFELPAFLNDSLHVLVASLPALPPIFLSSYFLYLSSAFLCCFSPFTLFSPSSASRLPELLLFVFLFCISVLLLTLDSLLLYFLRSLRFLILRTLFSLLSLSLLSVFFLCPTFSAHAIVPFFLLAALLEEWMRTVEQLLTDADSRKENPDAGPHTELEYWKERTGRFNSIVDQKNTPAAKIMLGALQVARGNSVLMRRWKGFDSDITDALNEAKDNVRFLTQLDKFLEPLYKGTPRTIIDALPALMNNLFIMQSVARYYNTKGE